MSARPKPRKYRPTTTELPSSVHQTRHELIREALRRFLTQVVESGDPQRVRSVACQAAAALDALLLGHPIDRRGRCRSCRRPGAVLTLRRRRCQVYVEAGFYLLGAGELLRTYLVRELGLADDPDTTDTEVLPAVESVGRRGDRATACDTLDWTRCG